MTTENECDRWDNKIWNDCDYAEWIGYKMILTHLGPGGGVCGRRVSPCRPLARRCRPRCPRRWPPAPPAPPPPGWSSRPAGSGAGQTCRRGLTMCKALRWPLLRSSLCTYVLALSHFKNILIMHSSALQGEGVSRLHHWVLHSLFQASSNIVYRFGRGTS